jgi:hypothetical protein
MGFRGFLTGFREAYRRLRLIYHFRVDAMKASDKIKAMDAFLEAARQETVEAISRDILQVLARHGFQAASSGERTRAAKAAVETGASKKKVWKPPPEGTDAYRVLHAIQAHRGFKSSEVKKIAETGGKPILAKTFKTALRRLRIRGFVTRDVQGRWYPAQKKETAA